MRRGFKEIMPSAIWCSQSLKNQRILEKHAQRRSMKIVNDKIQ
ncbi:hypothetical protein VII_000651 [Vibrio mimicus MB451]|nr:hypothetical protein VII_000651 [Vibrio mimicus MB451]